MLGRLPSVLLLLFGLVFPSVSWAAMDHKDVISGPFKSGQEVTEACLGCHEQQAADFMKTVHWTSWLLPPVGE